VTGDGWLVSIEHLQFLLTSNAVKTLLDFLLEHEREHPDRTWLTQPMGGGVLREFTGREAIDEACRLATYLKARGFESGTRIAIISRNGA